MSGASPWLRAVRSEARGRIVALSYAGGGTTEFRPWVGAVPGHIDVCPVVLPGREQRMSEPAIAAMEPLVDALAAALTPTVRLAPYTLYGHSMGSWVGFELCRALRRRGVPLPEHLFVAARRAPDLPQRGPKLSEIASDPAFADAIGAKYGGIPAAIRASPELMALFLPTLRADFGLLDRYVYRDEAPLEVPITALRGQQDTVVRHADVKGWQAHTAAAFTVRTVPGGHFFLRDCGQLVAGMVAATLHR